MEKISEKNSKLSRQVSFFLGALWAKERIIIEIKEILVCLYNRNLSVSNRNRLTQTYLTQNFIGHSQHIMVAKIL